jgi:hypothetical protein
MPCKERDNGRLYYYESYRMGGRVRSRYVGAGPMAELAEALDQLDRLYRKMDREAARDAERAKLKKIAELDEQVKRYCRGVELVFSAAMHERGYHRHDRGRWRKRRMATALAKIKTKSKTQTPVSTPRTATASARRFTREELQAIVDLAGTGDPLAMREYRAALASPEWRPILLELIGNPAGNLRRRLIETYGEKSLLTQETVKEGVKEMIVSLTPPEASALERLLAERVVTTWLALHLAEDQALGWERATPTPSLLEALSRRSDRCQRRFLAAVEALRTFRRVELPPMMLNAAVNQQINVGGAS